MIEHRRYLKYFNEKSSILRPEDNRYSFDLTFDLEKQQGTLRIPDPGGMMDMLAMSPQQEAWVVKILEGQNVNRTWTTFWELLDLETYQTVITLLNKNDAKFNSHRIDTKANELDELITFIKMNDFKLKSC